jgi:hypothetical protein
MYINDMKKRLIQSLILAFIPLCLFLCLNKIAAADALTMQLKGRILLQVQGHGEAWYVSPDNGERYYMGRPADAFNLMRTLGIGVSNADFAKFNGVAPKTLSGKILLKVQDKGQAYYVNPTDLKLYYLGRPADAFAVMRKLGLGITNTNLEKITAHTTQNLIGGDQDAHGCLPAAGYSWCPSTSKCQRMWEEYCAEFKDQYRGQTNSNATSSELIATTTESNLTATTSITVATSTVATTPTTTNKFLAEYFQNTNVMGSPIIFDYTDTINYNWARGGPAGIGRKINYSIRWTGNWQFDDGNYNFHADFDDGMNVYIDGAIVITSWRQGSQEKVIDKTIAMTAGWHEIKVEYYKLDNIGIAKLSWEKAL